LIPWPIATILADPDKENAVTTTLSLNWGGSTKHFHGFFNDKAREKTLEFDARREKKWNSNLMSGDVCVWCMDSHTKRDQTARKNERVKKVFSVQKQTFK
jgi:hypothetical protein